MRWTGARGFWMLLLFIVVGALLGGLLAEVLGSVSLAGMMPLLVRRYTLLDIGNIHFDLLILQLDFGIRFAPNLLSLIGIILAIWLFRRL